MAGKNTRVVDIKYLNSPYDADIMEYNPPSGGCKSLRVGPHLLPIPTGLNTWTTTPTTATGLPLLGMTLYVYNNSGTAGSITVGQSAAVTSQAIGGIDANGNVGVACPPNAYTYVSMGQNQWVITSSSSLIVYIVEDPTWIAQESGPYAQQNGAGTQPIS